MGKIIMVCIVFILWLFFARSHFVCLRGECDSEYVIKKTKVIQQEKKISTSLIPKIGLSLDDRNVLSNTFDSFQVQENGELELSDNNKVFLKSIANYLNQNKDRNIKIIGNYLTSEKNLNTRTFENIGLLRASTLMDKLSSNYGIESDRISIMSIDTSNLINPIQFKLSNKIRKKENIVPSIEKFKDLTLSDANFNKNSGDFLPKSQFIKYANSLHSFLKNKPKSKIIIIGHTDSDGDETSNYILGNQRSILVKNYFKNLGIKNTITTHSEGESMPIAPNLTEEGKSKNRRVIIQILNQ